METLATAVFSKQRFLLEGRNVSCKVEETVVTAVLGAAVFCLVCLEVGDNTVGGNSGCLEVVSLSVPGQRLV